MKRKKRVLFITIGPEITASSRIRAYNYKPLLQARGFSVRIIPYNIAADAKMNVLDKKPVWAIKAANKINHMFKCFLYTVIAPRYDVIYIQRALLPVFISRILKRRCGRLIFDFDDAIYLYDRLQKRAGSRKFSVRFENVLRSADRVVVSNKTLKEAALKLNPNVSIVPTPVDTEKFMPVERRGTNGEKLVVGWIGSPWAARYVEPLKEVFENLHKKYPSLELRLIGARPFYGWKVPVDAKQWILEGEAAELRNFDIGIMPLGRDEWCKGKSGYKLLQYMAAGVPCLASAVEISRELINDGVNGFLADSDAQWRDRLERLIQDRGLRLKMGAAGRKLVEEGYSYKTNLALLEAVLGKEKHGT